MVCVIIFVYFAKSPHPITLIFPQYWYILNLGPIVFTMQITADICTRHVNTINVAALVIMSHSKTYAVRIFEKVKTQIQNPAIRYQNSLITPNP